MEGVKKTQGVSKPVLREKRITEASPGVIKAH